MAPKRNKHITSEEAYIKTILKVQREEIGLEPPKTHKSKKTYSRKGKNKPIIEEEDD